VDECTPLPGVVDARRGDALELGAEGEGAVLVAVAVAVAAANLDAAPLALQLLVTLIRSLQSKGAEAARNLSGSVMNTRGRLDSRAIVRNQGE